MIIGITGQKGVGKSLAARYLRDILDNTAIVSFATPVKSMVDCLVTDALSLYHNSESVAMIELAHAKNNKDEVITGVGASYRKLCQEITKAGQAANPNLWDNIGFDQCNKLLAEGYKYIIVDDVRYESTASILRQSGFRVLHIVNITNDNGEIVDSDISEQRLLFERGDWLINNDKTPEFFNALKSYKNTLIEHEPTKK